LAVRVKTLRGFAGSQAPLGNPQAGSLGIVLAFPSGAWEIAIHPQPHRVSDIARLSIPNMKTILLCLMPLVVSQTIVSDTEPKFVEKTLLVGEKTIQAEIADTPQARERGLMLRKSMPANHGMLFIFDDTKILSFWMKDTHIPLDIGFFDERKKLIEVHTMKPMSTDIIHSSKPAKYGLEMNAGWFKNNQIERGDAFSILGEGH
jgi:uncharacterized membrane protein (UPF0127 family)